MGRSYTTTGIAFNLGGTAVPAGTTKHLDLRSSTSYIQFGTGASDYIECTPTAFNIVTPGKNMLVSSEYTGTIHIYAGDSRVKISIGTASTAGLVVLNDQGAGTLMTLDGSGNLKVKGSLGTGQSF